MGDHLRVDPVDLMVSSDQLAALEREHVGEHGSARDAIISAIGKWIGTSATAMQGKVGFLQLISTNIAHELEHNSKALRRIGANFERTDEMSAAEILLTRQEI